MTSVRPTSPSTRRRPMVAATLVVVGSMGLLGATAGTAQAAPAASPVLLGTAEPFAVLSGSAFTNTGTTTIAGDIGASNPSMVGTSSIVLTGTNHGNDGVTANANAALTNARVTAAGQGPGDIISTDLAGQTLTPGIYTSDPSSLSIAGPLPLILDGQGDPNAVFLFQATSTLITQPNTRVSLINGATACNVFWEVASSTTLGVDSVFRGVVLTQFDTTLNTRATIEGSVLSSGSVSLDSNTIIRPACASTPAVPPVVLPPTSTPPSSTPPSSTPPSSTPPTSTPLSSTPTSSTPTSSTPPSSMPTATASTPAPGSARAGTTGRPTYGQVGRVPVGAVDTGDGSTS